MYNKSDTHYERPSGVNMCGCLGPMYGEPLCPCSMARAGLPMSVEHVEANKQSQEDLKGLAKFFEKNRNAQQAIDTRPV